MTLTHLADAHASGSDLAVARNACISAIAILEGLGHPDADRLPAKLGPSAQTRAGEPIHTRDQHLHTENVLSSIADPAHKRLGLRGSTQRLIQCLTWCLPFQGLSRSFVEFSSHTVEVTLRNGFEVGAPGEILAQQAVGVLVRAALPW